MGMWIHHHTAIVRVDGLGFEKSAKNMCVPRTETTPLCLCCDWCIDQMQCGCQILACHIEGVCHHSFDVDKRGMWIHHHTDIVTSVGLESWKSAEVFIVCPSDRNHALMLWLRPQINPKWLPQPCITYKVFAIIHMMQICMWIYHHTVILIFLGLGFAKSAEKVCGVGRTETISLCCDWGLRPTQSDLHFLVWHLEGVCHHSFDVDKRGMWIHHHAALVTFVGLYFWKSAEVLTVCPPDRNHALMLWLRPQTNTKWLSHPCLTFRRCLPSSSFIWCRWACGSIMTLLLSCWVRFCKVSWKGVWCQSDRNNALMLWLRPQTNTKWFAPSCLIFRI